MLQKGKVRISFSTEYQAKKILAETSDSNTNNKTKNVAEKMFDNRKGDAIKSRHMWKIKSFQRLTDLQRSYNARILTRSFVTVTICNNPNCDCNDFKKNNEKVFCKHILFLVIIVLNGEHLEEQLIKQFLSDVDLKVLFGSEIPANFLHQKSKRANNIDIKTILATHPLHQQEQK